MRLGPLGVTGLDHFLPDLHCRHLLIIIIIIIMCMTNVTQMWLNSDVQQFKNLPNMVIFLLINYMVIKT